MTEKGRSRKLRQQTKKTKQPNKPKKTRAGWHLFIISTFSLALVCQLVVSRSKQVDLHYQIEKIEYEIGKIQTERNAYYQHQAELTKLSRLKESIAAEDAKLEGNRIYRLEQES